MSRDARLEGLELDIDIRLADLWSILWDPRNILRGVVEDETLCRPFSTFLRAAYSKGYQDALREDREGRRGELARANGYTHV